LAIEGISGKDLALPVDVRNEAVRHR
jgi:hypothetical protein